MKKIEFIESIKYSLKTINETMKYDNTLLELVIDSFYSDFMYRMYNPNDPLDLYTKRYSKEIQDDDGEYYVELDVKPIVLPNQAGVYYVKSNGGKSLAPLNSIEVDILDSLGCNRVDSKGTYYVTSDRVYIQLYDDMREIKNIYVGIIPTFKDYDDTDEIYMPKQASSVILNEVAKFLANKPQVQDMINDNSDNLKANETK